MPYEVIETNVEKEHGISEVCSPSAPDFKHIQI